MLTQVQKQDPRTRRTRQLLVQAFDELLKEKSFQSITVQDITERATVNRATFYAHFEDKYALLNYSIRQAFRRRLDSRLPDGANFSPETLRILILALCEFMTEFHRHCKPSDQQFLPLVETTITAELYDVLLSWLKKATSTQPGGGAPVEVAAVVASWAIYGAAVQWSREKRSGSADEFVSQVLPMILMGLSQVTR